MCFGLFYQLLPHIVFGSHIFAAAPAVDALIFIVIAWDAELIGVALGAIKPYLVIAHFSLHWRELGRWNAHQEE